MICRINKGIANGVFQAPPSKSVAHRMLICGALSEKSIIRSVAFSEDILATIDCLKALGAKVTIDNDFVTIGGIDFGSVSEIDTLPCRESGSTLRFLIPLCLLMNQKIELIGSKRLFERSLSVYEKIAKEQNIEFEKGTDSLRVSGRLVAGKYTVRGDVSSQFISGLLFALPVLDNDSIIFVEGELESGSYIDITLKALNDFGIVVERPDSNTFFIKGNQKYLSRDVAVEGDYSNAAFFEAMNLFGSKVEIKGLKEDSLQGDKKYKEYFEALNNGAAEIAISDCPDLGPILMAVAAAKNGGIFTGTRRLKIKESDRGFAMQSELFKMGCRITVEDNRIIVPKYELTVPTEPICGHNDHRIVMAMTVLLTLTGGEIKGTEAVSKSFPDFFEKLNSLGKFSEVL